MSAHFFLWSAHNSPPHQDTSTYIYVRMYAHTYIRTYVHTYVHTCVHTCVCRIYVKDMLVAGSYRALMNMECSYTHEIMQKCTEYMETSSITWHYLATHTHTHNGMQEWQHTCMPTCAHRLRIHWKARDWTRDWITLWRSGKEMGDIFLDAYTVHTYVRTYVSEWVRLSSNG